MIKQTRIIDLSLDIFLDRALSFARSVAFYSRISSSRPGTFDPRVCHIRNTRAAISGPSLRNESLLIFTRRFARTRDAYLCKGDECEKRRDVVPFESREQNGERRGPSYRIAEQQIRVVVSLHAKCKARLCVCSRYSTRFLLPTVTLALSPRRLFVHGSFRFDGAFTGLTPLSFA